jgi:hypothetical protein
VVTEKQRNTIANEKNRHEVNAEKSEHMFITYVENVEERHNIKVSNTSFCEDIIKKIKTAFTNKLFLT